MILLPSLLVIAKKLFFISLALAALGFLITIHEFGHFLFCKIFDVSTPSFSIGFGPKIWKRQLGETLFSISLIPLGGYVEIGGSEEIGQGEQKESQRIDHRSIKSKPYWQKIVILFGGVMFNLLFAYKVMILLFALGTPKTPFFYPQNATNRIESLQENSPAQKSNLLANDIIIGIDNKIITTHSDLLTILKELKDQPTTITIQRNGTTQIAPITPEFKTINGTKTAFIGVNFTLNELPARPLKQAIKDGITATNNFIRKIIVTFKNMFTEKKIGDIGGPVMIISEIAQSAQRGFKMFLLLIALISVNLAVLNLLPLPILDGGQALMYTIEALIRRELPSTIKMIIHIICWIGFLLLTLYLTYRDLGATVLGTIIRSWFTQ